jgi:outer membrane lipoprotein SlyB
MNQSNLRSTVALLAVTVALGACAPATSPSSRSSNQAGRVVPVQFGTITSIVPVEIRPGQTRLGRVAGAVIGGAAGSTIGRSTAANVAGATAGAVAGGAVGGAVQGSGRTQGVELTLRLDSGETVAIVQPGRANDYRIGDRVRLTGTADNARVTR